MADLGSVVLLHTDGTRPGLFSVCIDCDVPGSELAVDAGPQRHIPHSLDKCSCKPSGLRARTHTHRRSGRWRLVGCACGGIDMTATSTLSPPMA